MLFPKLLSQPRGQVVVAICSPLNHLDADLGIGWNQSLSRTQRVLKDPLFSICHQNVDQSARTRRHLDLLPVTSF
jgi:hypothetical protein